MHTSNQNGCVFFFSSSLCLVCRNRELKLKIVQRANPYNSYLICVSHCLTLAQNSLLKSPLKSIYIVHSRLFARKSLCIANWRLFSNAARSIAFSRIHSALCATQYIRFWIRCIFRFGCQFKILHSEFETQIEKSCFSFFFCLIFWCKNRQLVFWQTHTIAVALLIDSQSKSDSKMRSIEIFGNKFR